MNSSTIKENVVDQQHYTLFDKQLNVGFGFEWKQRQMMIPGKGEISMPTWQAHTLNLMGVKSPRPQFVLSVRRTGNAPVALDATKPAPQAGPQNAPVAPVKPKSYGRYNIRLYLQPSGAYEVAMDSKLIFESVIDGLEESGQPFGLKEYLMNKFKINNVSAIKVWPTKIANQDFGNWYSGQVPDPKQLEPYVGSSNVDASQISSAFNGVGKAISFVNQFDGSLLRNIAFIFNTSGNAYGVYVPALDQAINNEKTKNLLKEKGCIVEDMPNGAFSAHPQDPSKISPDQIQNEINRIEGEMKTSGGHAFGINMNKVLESAKADQANLQQKTSKDFDFLAMIHLGETMAHEATHAAGHQDEGAPMSVQQSFVQWVLPKIDEERRQLWLSENQGATPDQYVPIKISSGMRQANWYRNFMEKIAFNGKAGPSGAQFQGRFNNNRDNKPPAKEGTTPSWAGMFWKGPHAAIENMLQQPDGGFSNKDSIEKRMRLERRKSSMPKLDPHALTSELIDADRKPAEAYSSTEKLLEDQRPKAMILSSSKPTVKTAYTDGVDANAPGFENVGWMQNLKLDVRERMKTGVEVDDDLATNQDETIHNDRTKSIKEGPRYNPEYSEENGCKGMFNSFWYEPRFEPEKWDDMVDERTRTSPASRFSSDNMQHLRDLADFILNAMETAKEEIRQGDFKGTRFLVSASVAKAMVDYFKSDVDIKILPFDHNGRFSPVWIAASTVEDSSLEQCEKFANGSDCSEHSFQVFDEVTSLSNIKKESINAIIEAAKEICKTNGLSGVYIVGGYPRSLVLKEKYAEIRDLDFASPFPDECLKLSGMLAEKLGVQNQEFLHRTMTSTWMFEGIKCDFRGKSIPMVDRQLFHEAGIKTTPLNLDIYARDLTINMMIYNLADGKIYDVTKRSASDLQDGNLRTYFPADRVVPANPLIILRVLKYVNRYPKFIIDPELQAAMKANIDGINQLGEDRIAKGISDVLREGKVRGEQLLAEYGIGLHEFRIGTK